MSRGLETAVNRLRQAGFELRPGDVQACAGRLAPLVAAAYRIAIPRSTGVARHGYLLWWTALVQDAWTGATWAYLTAPLDDRPLVAMVSSRMGRDYFPHAGWMTSIRQSLALSRGRWRWLVCENTTTAEWLRHGCRRMGESTLVVRADRRAGSGEQSWRRWFERIASAPSGEPVLLVSPVVESPQATDVPPQIDRMAFALSDGLICLSRRPGGNVDRLWRQRHAERIAGRWQLDLACTESPWPEWDLAAVRLRKPRIVGRLPWPALCHWTRRCDGPWPGEEKRLWRDRVLLLSASARRDAWATLLAMLREGRIRGGSRSLRGSRPMVSWTAQPLERWPALRTFRRGRHRWDFEPYGIAVEREAVRREGARPVWYGSEADFAAATPRQRQLGQLRRSRRGTVDWTREREWRSPGDFPFSRLPQRSVVVFVSDYGEARQVAGEFGYRVYLMRQGSEAT